MGGRNKEKKKNMRGFWGLKLGVTKTGVGNQVKKKTVAKMVKKKKKKKRDTVKGNGHETELIYRDGKKNDVKTKEREGGQ